MRRGGLLTPAAVALSLAVAGGGWVYARWDRTPVELPGHTEHPLEVHPGLQAVLFPSLQWGRERANATGNGVSSPLDLRGAVAGGLPGQTYDARGVPEEASVGNPASSTPRRLVGSDAELVAVLDNARAGDVIEVLPGRYELKRNLWLQRAGTAAAPIVVRAAVLGTVRIELRSEEGFVVAAPYWVFENLHLAGRCVPANRCQHAFHVVGEAHATVLRNNVLQDFNNAIKVNGRNGEFPDHGLVQHNHIFNTGVREGDSPVVGLDIVGASGWRVADNLIADIAKASKVSPSYAAFMKGGGSEGSFERNLVVCRLNVKGRGDIRVGLSLGGGGTGTAYRRPGRSLAEFDRGAVVNNVIAFCNDFGVDLNRATQARVAFNTLIATAGIGLRNQPVNASIDRNVVAGGTHPQGGRFALDQYNATETGDRRALASMRANLRESAAEHVSALAAVDRDYCGQARGQGMTAAGAFASPASCSLLQPTPLRVIGEAVPNS